MVDFKAGEDPQGVEGPQEDIKNQDTVLVRDIKD